MKLKSYRVTKFRNIVDSGDIAVDLEVTCLVGKNEAGKSGLLEALYLLNPAYEETFNVEEQYPRWLVVRDRRNGKLEEHCPITAVFELEPAEIEAVHERLGKNVLPEANDNVSVCKQYNGDMLWDIPYDSAAASKNLIEKFPPAVRDKFSACTELEEILNVLESLKADDTLDGEDVGRVSAGIEETAGKATSFFDAILKDLESGLPSFFRFTAYSGLPGRIDFRDIVNKDETGPGNSSIQAARALLKLAGTDLNQLGQEDYELRKGELEAVQIDLTDQVFEYWKQNPNLEVLIDVDKATESNANGHKAVARFLDIRLKDQRTGYSNNFSQRSSGFQWFFSFLAAFSEFDEKGKNAPIVLLDEPALTLHGKAQADFLRFINERLAPNTPVIYTTHSPFMVEASRIERVRVIEDQGPPNGSVVIEQAAATDKDSLFPLQAALGYDIAQNLFIGENNLVVEGASDFIYLTLLSQICKASKKEYLDERWRILPTGGATNIPAFVGLIGPHLDITVLADSDTRGMQRVTNMVDGGILAEQRLIFASAAVDSDKADIEDLFEPADYLTLYNSTYGQGIEEDSLNDRPRIVKRIESTTGDTYIHGEVAETFLRSHQEFQVSEKTLDRFSKLFSIINNTIKT